MRRAVCMPRVHSHSMDCQSIFGWRTNVRSQGKSGRDLLVLSVSQFDPERTSLAVADSRRSVLICTDSADTDLESLWRSHPQGLQEMLLFMPLRKLSGEVRPIL